MVPYQNCFRQLGAFRQRRLHHHRQLLHEWKHDCNRKRHSCNEKCLVTFTQTSSYRFNVTLKGAVGGNPCLIVDNATINTNTYPLPIMLQENSTAYINGMRLATNSYISLILYESSHANISNSTFVEVRAYHSSTLNFAYSRATMVDVDHESHLNMENANIYVLYGVGNAEAQVKNSTIIHTLGIEANTTQCIINKTKPGLVTKWNFLENCSSRKRKWGVRS